MPNYDYRCADGHVTTAGRTIGSRDNAPACSECAGETARMFVAAPAIFKGDGFASTSDRYAPMRDAARGVL